MEQKCGVCWYPAHLECDCKEPRDTICPSCVCRHLRLAPTVRHRFFPLNYREKGCQQSPSESATVPAATPAVSAGAHIPQVSPDPITQSADTDEWESGDYECVLCGEVANSFQKYKAHMSAHLL